MWSFALALVSPHMLDARCRASDIYGPKWAEFFPINTVHIKGCCGYQKSIYLYHSVKLQSSLEFAINVSVFLSRKIATWNHQKYVYDVQY